MNQSRYMRTEDKSPNTVKRRLKGRPNDEQPAITLLPLNPNVKMNAADFAWEYSPRVYRAVAPRSAKNREASSFVIIGDTLFSPAQSRSSSPSGRVTPFRGHGFKSPKKTRPNSRVTSPSSSPRKAHSSKVSEKSFQNSIYNREPFNRFAGLPPKSPMRTIKPHMSDDIKPMNSNTSTKPSETERFINNSENLSTTENLSKEKSDFSAKDGIVTEKMIEGEKQESCEIEENEEDKEPREYNLISESRESGGINATTPHTTPHKTFYTTPHTTPHKTFYTTPPTTPYTTFKKHQDFQKEDCGYQRLKSDEKLNDNSEFVEKLMPADFYKECRGTNIVRSTTMPQTPKSKSKFEKNQSSFQRKDQINRNSGKPPVPPRKTGLKSILKTSDNKNQRGKSSGKEKLSEKNGKKSSALKKREQSGKTKNSEVSREVNSKHPTHSVNTENFSIKELNEEKKFEDEKVHHSTTNNTSQEINGQADKLIPCYQPDKCNIAPPTMASPSPIITPSISTPSTSADLALSSTKNSQSISTAPTTVTSCSMSSVPSTVVLPENLVRKENERTTDSNIVDESDNRIEKPDFTVSENHRNISGSDDKEFTQMVKAGTKILVKEKSSGEISSGTKVIKAEPDMEVLSPNNLRNSPPRMEPMNVAWDEERVPNGDVPVQVTKEGKFKRFFFALWKFFKFLLCCRCLKCLLCCRKTSANAEPSKRNSCCNCCGPFKCLTCKCDKPKCCEGRRCCRRKTNEKSKSKSKRNCCAKPLCNCKNCCLVFRDKINNFCRCLFCFNLTCCQSILKKCKCCHKLKCCQSNGCCSCCNPYATMDSRTLMKKDSRASNNSRGKDQLDVVLVEHNSKMKAAIPVLPSCLAVFCLICNTFIPGFGTILSGVLCLCFGKPRFSSTDNLRNRLKSFIVNLIIGVAQAFTVIFCLVGWGWSIWWGIIMYKLSRRQKRLKLAEKNQKEPESSNANLNHGDVEQG